MLEQDLFQIINRKNKLFESDINELESELSNIIKSSSFLIIGAGGSIGQAVTKEIALRAPKTLHCIDVSENSLVELVRDLRSSNLMLKDFKHSILILVQNFLKTFMNMLRGTIMF